MLVQTGLRGYNLLEMNILSAIGSSTEILPSELGLTETGIHLPGFDAAGAELPPKEEEIVRLCSACCKEVAHEGRVCPHCRSDIPRL